MSASASFRVFFVATVLAVASALSFKLPFATLANATKLSKTRLGRIASKYGRLSAATNCGGPNDHAKNLQISILPDAPKAGELVTTTFKYDLDKEVTSGVASYAINFNGIPLPATNDDLCVDQAGGVAPDPCPLKVGHHDNISESDFPSGVSGKITTTIKWTDQDKEQILCVQWVVRV
jgi:hypothetical protein